jgi:hypothetical protein
MARGSRASIIKAEKTRVDQISLSLSIIMEKR